MNILFVTNSVVSPLNSGIQRITYTLAKSFTARGISCYGAYYEETNTPSDIPYLATLRLDGKEEHLPQLTAFLEEHRIDFIIAQECHPLSRLVYLRKALPETVHCRLFYCFHSIPGKEFVPPSASIEGYRLLHETNKMHSLKKLMVACIPAPLYRLLVRQKVKRHYRTLYRLADKIILLSDSLIPIFSGLLSLPEVQSGKIAAIGNSLSFPDFLPASEISSKQKEVLIVARLSDRAKRISLALKIWRQIEKNPQLNEWTLKIVGAGPDEKYYRHLCKRWKLARVSFEGRQNPLPYYQRASLYMLTSIHEGFAIVLTEAQQMGVVPLAFDSFSTVHDIIENGQNGCLVPPQDINTYAESMTELMTHPSVREIMARNGLESCKRFSEKEILKKWLAIFDFKQ